MATGNSALLNAAQLNGQAGDLAVRLRAWAADAAAFHSAIVALGAAGLEAAGFTPGDAAAYAAKADVLYTVAAIYLGQAIQPDPYNFDSALAEWCGTRSR
jgi:hypothetical protein